MMQNKKLLDKLVYGATLFYLDVGFITNSTDSKDSTRLYIFSLSLLYMEYTLKSQRLSSTWASLKLNMMITNLCALLVCM